MRTVGWHGEIEFKVQSQSKSMIATPDDDTVAFASVSWARAPGPPLRISLDFFAIPAARSSPSPTRRPTWRTRPPSASRSLPSPPTIAALIERDDIDLIDVCTPSHTHFELAWAALDAGKHVLCEKPVAYDFRDTRRAAALAREKGLKTKLGFTFRYAPAMRYMRALVAEGFIGEPFIFNGFEQNSQWLDPQTPLRQADHLADQSVLQVSSLEGYGAPIIDIAPPARRRGPLGRRRHHAQLHSRASGARDRAMMRMNIDDGDIFMGEFANGALVLDPDELRDGRQLSRYRGADLRVQGRDHLPPRRGGRHLRAALVGHPDQVEFRELPVPERFYPPGGNREESWRSLFYANLVSSFISEILGEAPGNEGNFDDGAWVQETINAVEASYRERRWVTLPLA